MKQLTCEMCGSTDLLKQEGCFVCQTCGTKYSVEEAKKMMIEGTVDVSGSTIKVDNSAFVEKYLANARRAMQKEDWEEAEKYYNLVEQNDPSNIEAIFYSSYAKARSLMIDSDHFKREHGLTVLAKCTSIIDDNYVEGNMAIVEKISKDLIVLGRSSFVYKGIDKDKNSDTFDAFARVHESWAESLVNIGKKTTIHEEKKTAYQLALFHCEEAKERGYGRGDAYHEAHRWMYANDKEYAREQDELLREEQEKAERKKKIEEQVAAEKEARRRKELEDARSKPALVMSIISFALIYISGTLFSPISIFLGIKARTVAVQTGRFEKLANFAIAAGVIGTIIGIILIATMANQ